MPHKKLWGVFLLLFPFPIFGDPPGPPPPAEETEAAPRNYGNLRVGASSASRNGRPEICAEVSPHRLLSIEGCGTGAGFLHQDPEPELARFRAKLQLPSWQAGSAWLRPSVGLGFAELQIDEDSPGFQFQGTGAGVSTAGPEVSAGLQALLPTTGPWELIGALSVGAAWLPHAPELVIPQSTFQPSVSVSLGIGF